MNVVHLTASTFHGGPERQMLGLARSLPAGVQTVFLSFPEGGRCRQFLSTARHHGFEAVGLTHDTPSLWAAMREVAGHLDRVGADVLCCHGYKANLVGRLAARRRKIPVVAVARGWTAENFKVRLYERLDRFHLRWMDHVVCVSEAQAAKVRRAGVRPERMSVIYNAIDPSRFAESDKRYRAKLLRYFRQPRTRVIGAAGRLSPEKGFEILVSAAERVQRTHPSVGFILFGEGPERALLQQQVNAAGLNHTFILSGFRADLDRFLPHIDLLVLPSYTEGLPNVVLEAFAAGVPVVGTAVGGTTEVIEDGVSGHLVPPGDADAMAERIGALLAGADKLPEMGRQGLRRVQEKFGFATQARLYHALFVKLRPDASSKDSSEPETGAGTQTERQESAMLPETSADDDLFAMGATWDR
jgi:glycosyltransferase involved in cell wall biosynthesis